MNEDDLRDCFAMFAMVGWIMNGDYHEDEIPHKAYRMADKMIQVRKASESGIIAVKPKQRRSKDETQS